MEMKANSRRSFLGAVAALLPCAALARTVKPSGPVFYIETKAYKILYIGESRESSRAYCFRDDMTYSKWSVSGSYVGRSAMELRNGILAKYPDAVFKNRDDEPKGYAGLEWRLTELVEHWNHTT
jgi:hypothetical protein